MDQFYEVLMLLIMHTQYHKGPWTADQAEVKHIAEPPHNMSYIIITFNSIGQHKQCALSLKMHAYIMINRSFYCNHISMQITL